MGKPNVLILGTGSIGSLFAAYLSSVVDVYCVGRREHIHAISQRGKIKVNKLFSGEAFEAPVKSATDRLEDLRGIDFDYVFVATKAFDLYEALKRLVEKNIEFNTIVLLQNGIGIVEEAKKALVGLKTCIVRAITYNGANIPRPGEVNHAGLGETLVGVLDKECVPSAEEVTKILSETGLPARLVEDIRAIEYEKLVVNATINPLTAILKVKNGFIAVNDWVREIAFRIVDEFLVVAGREGVEVKDPKRRVIEVAEKTAENISSMLQDVLAGRRTEIDYINGKLVEIGRKHGLELPFNETIYRLVKSIEKIDERYKIN